jgi:NAD(P)-dependent dehydrogenase (short-subunit alcohol dehydrogenase family)
MEKNMNKFNHALIVGAGAGLSASIARQTRASGMIPLLASRNIDKLSNLLEETQGEAMACNVSDPQAVDQLFSWVETNHGIPDLVVYNPSARVQGPIVELDQKTVAECINITAYGGFLVGQAAVRLMLQRGSGTIIFTGASASVKGYANSAPFAMGKFALRGLAQSMARELSPKGIHVGHVVIDGGIGRSDADAPNLLDPDDIAKAYFQLHNQPKSTWTLEIELRPWVENF